MKETSAKYPPCEETEQTETNDATTVDGLANPGKPLQLRDNAGEPFQTFHQVGKTSVLSTLLAVELHDEESYVWHASAALVSMSGRTIRYSELSFKLKVALRQATAKLLHGVMEYRRLRLPCPFLDIPSGDCTIYEDRPLACRMHIASGPRHHYEQDDLRPNQEFVTLGGGPVDAYTAALVASGCAIECDHFILLVHERLTGKSIKSGTRFGNFKDR